MIKRTLYFGNPAFLSLRNGQMVIDIPGCKDSDVPPPTRPVEDLGIVVLDNKQITITSGLLQALVENQTAVLTCDNRGLPIAMLLPMVGNNVQTERYRVQLESSLPLRKQLWQQTVSAKIANQSAFLKQRTDVETGNMDKWSKNVKSGDTENLEARAAVYYWKSLFEEQFPMFVRGKEGEPPNNLLNYGYAILRSIAARSLVVSGLLPTVGIFHHNRYNAYCLADDIMEPYRPFVDRLVCQITDHFFQIDTLSVEIKRELLSIPTLDVFINGQRSPLMLAVGQTTASLYKCFSGEQRLIVYPDMGKS